MNFKRISSAFLLFTLLISNISIPLTVKADECEVTSADFLGKPNGPNWYKEGKIVQLKVSINRSDSCAEKKIFYQIVQTKTLSKKDESVKFTETPQAVTFDPGETVAHAPLVVGEELCSDLDQNSIETETTLAGWFGDNINQVLDRVGMSEEDFNSKVYDHLKSTEEYTGLQKGWSSIGGGTDLIPVPWYDANQLKKEESQSVIDNVDNLFYPSSKLGFGDYLSLAMGVLPGVTNIGNKTDYFQDFVAKNIFYKIGIYDCNYKVQTKIDDGEWENKGELNFMCEIGITGAGNDCKDLWEQKTGFSPGIRPTVITDSLCLNEDGSTYDEDCYETLAPIPGFGRKLNFSEDGGKGTPFTLGTYIGTVVKITIGAASVAAVIFLTYAGIMYMIAGKSGGGALLDQARKRLINVAWGLAVILGSWILLNTINPELLKINPKIDRVTLEAPEQPVEISGPGITRPANADQRAYSNGKTFQVPFEYGGTTEATHYAVEQKFIDYVRANGPIMELTKKDGTKVQFKPCDDSTIHKQKIFGVEFGVHDALVPSLRKIEKEWNARGGNTYYQIRETGGTYLCRRIWQKGKPTLNITNHSYGLAIDINPNQNQQGGKKNDMSNQNPPFHKLMEDNGWGWGYKFNDPMHFSVIKKEYGSGVIE